MDSPLFVKGPQMGNKMFVQLFNVKNIHVGVRILRPARVSLSRLRARGCLEGGKRPLSEMPATPTAEPGHGLLRALATGAFPADAGQQRSRPRCPGPCVR